MVDLHIQLNTSFTYHTMNIQFKTKSTLIAAIIVAIFWICTPPIMPAQMQNIKNNRFWDTVDRQPIFSQGGGIFRFIDPKSGTEKYFWYGVEYREAALYRNDPSVTQPKDFFLGVTCYTSTDLVNWKSEGYVLTRENVVKHHEQTTWMGRMGVVFVPEIKKYAMFIQHVEQLLILTSDSPTGPFEWHHRKNMEAITGTTNTGDQTVFTDYDAGKSYLIYSNGRGRNRIFISEIGVVDGRVDLLDHTQIFRGAGREGNCMFKYKGRYYMFASNLYGWDSSYAYYLVADDIRGPYLPENNMLITPGSMDDYAHVTQTGFFVNVKGSKQETVVYCGDRWANFAGNGLGYNQWVPLSFDGKTPHFNSLDSWNLNARTGEWEVAKNNNYAKNGSFEADRKYIPAAEKPLQEQLKGWYSKVYQGNDIVIGSSDSPVLNFYNTQEDRKVVVGEKSLNIEDKVDFRRKVFQVVESTGFVKLPDGCYTLTAKIRNNAQFKLLEMYAESAGRTSTLKIESENKTWTTISLKGVYVSNAKVEIGFHAIGNAGASCQIDDVSFVREF